MENIDKNIKTRFSQNYGHGILANFSFMGRAAANRQNKTITIKIKTSRAKRKRKRQCCRDELSIEGRREVVYYSRSRGHAVHSS